MYSRIKDSQIHVKAVVISNKLEIHITYLTISLLHIHRESCFSSRPEQKPESQMDIRHVKQVGLNDSGPPTFCGEALPRLRSELRGRSSMSSLQVRSTCTPDHLPVRNEQGRVQVAFN